MAEKIKKLLGEDKSLEERIFTVILVVALAIVLVSTVVTVIEKLGMFASVSTLMAAVLLLVIMMINFIWKKERLARVMLCYVMNCFVLPVTFFSCGGIDSGMVLYILAGLFLIIPTLKGMERIVCFVISLICHVCTIGISYNFMAGNKAKTQFTTNILAKLTLEDRIIDMIASITLVSLFVCMTTYLILSEYQKERHNKEILLERLDDLSKKDELTGLFNRRELFRHFESVGLFSERKYYVAMFDIDRFKSINDTYGHLFGDLALKEISAELNGIINPAENEIAARYGGEEFVLLLRAKDDEEALRRVENVRKRVEHLKWEDYPNLVITISGGIINCFGYNQLTSMLAQADELLYKAKHSGRNCIISQKNSGVQGIE
ncbi:MAG: GGDEF domain-containing protein [Lachnospiraceae bacterium]|nr:GGDEF domain-containing protein [Lachnospiraceae bacterium]